MRVPFSPARPPYRAMPQTKPAWIAALVALVGCAEEAPQAAQRSFEPVADVNELMLTILEPAAERYWDAVGWIDDRDQGTIEIEPRTDEEWEAVRNAAFVIAESGNLLMIQGRAREEPDWIPMARSLVAVGREAIGAAESRDKMRVFNTGADVYYVCTNCHAIFARETLRPADERARGNP